MKQQNLFDLKEGERQRDQGMDLALTRDGVESLIDYARRIAATIAQKRSDFTVTIDDVMKVLVKKGYAPSDLGMAAGSVFKCSMFRFTGRTMKTERISSHARPVSVWELRPAYRSMNFFKVR